VGKGGASQKEIWGSADGGRKVKGNPSGQDTRFGVWGRGKNCTGEKKANLQPEIRKGSLHKMGAKEKFGAD